MFKEKIASSNTVSVYIAGPVDAIERVCAKFCESGFCVSVFPCAYVYRFGMERGAEVRLINYPRFPLKPDELLEKAKELGRFLAFELSQGSYTVCGQGCSYFYSRRGDE